MTKNLTLVHALLRAAEVSPHAEALVYGPRRQSYTELVSRVGQTAAVLSMLGVKKGQVVPILAMNSDHYFEYFLATSWAGYVACPLNWRWSARELASALNECEANVLLVGRGFETVARSLIEVLGRPLRLAFIGDGIAPPGVDVIDDMLPAAAPASPLSPDSDDMFGIYYTGGTTGAPKGVMLSHAGVVASATAMLVAGEVEEQVRYLRCVPMFHYGDSAWSIAALARGGTNIIMERFEIEPWLATIGNERVTAAAVVPSMLSAVCASEKLQLFDVSSLRRLTYGGSPASAPLLARARQVFPSARFSQGYGMTEYSSNMTLLAPADHDNDERLLSSAGRANFATRLRIVDPRTGAAMPAGERGEIQVSGPQMMLGYFRHEKLTKEAIQDGWLRTGDIGYCDDAGYLFIVDRLKDMIVTGGENVYSAEVERIVATHPAVAESAVIGVPHARWGEAVHAVVVLKVGLTVTAEELRDHCATMIARFKCPASVEFRDAMPLSPLGKISKPDLRAKYWGKDRQVN